MSTSRASFAFLCWIVLAACSTRGSPSLPPAGASAEDALSETTGAAHWIRTAVPRLSNFGNDLLSIRAFSSSDIYAAGLTQTPVVEHWNGTSWTRVSFALPGVQSLTSLTIGGETPQDLWLGADELRGPQAAALPFSFHLQSGKWYAEPLPALPSGFNGGIDQIKATSAGNAWALIDAVDFSSGHEKPMLARWTGARWENVPVAAPNNAGSAFQTRVGAIDATSASDLWLVGFVPQIPAPSGFIEHFNGVSWRQLPLPTIPVHDADGAEVFGVYERNADDVWAVGNVWIWTSPTTQAQRTLTLHWNGVRWSYVPSPSFGSLSVTNALNAVSGDGTPTDIWAVGTAGSTLPIAIKWNGSAWITPEQPSQFANGSLDAVAVLGTYNVWSVGTGNSSQDDIPVADHYVY